jgi:hypothetical protein
MIPLHDISRDGETQPPLLRALRLVTRIARVRNRAAALSLVVWLLCVAGFAVWTLHYYEAPAGGVPWIGMTIRTSVVASWLLVAREWRLIQIQRRHAESSPHKQDTHD